MKFLDIFWKLKMDMLIIGRNNVFYIDNSNFSFVSHVEVENINLSKYSKVVVTAFDPQKKIQISKNKPVFLTTNLLKQLKKMSVYYISTARANFNKSTNSSMDYEIYVNNKIYEEDLFLNECLDATVCRVPNLLNYNNLYQSKFQKILKLGIQNNLVKFDTTIDSSWNFLFSRSVLKWIFEDKGEFKGSKMTLMSNQKTTAEDISNYVFLKKNCRTLYGNKHTSYPLIDFNNVLLFEDQREILRVLVG